MPRKQTKKHHGALSKKIARAPRSGMEMKDLATPRKATATTRRRASRRAAQTSSGGSQRRFCLQPNVISSLLLGHKTPKNRFERCLLKDALKRSRHSDAVQCATEPLCIACGACAAKQSRDCICTALVVLHGNVNSRVLSEFAAGVRSLENPVYQPVDPDDQQKIKASMENGVALLLKSHTHTAEHGRVGAMSQHSASNVRRGHDRPGFNFGPCSAAPR